MILDNQFLDFTYEIHAMNVDLNSIKLNYNNEHITLTLDLAI